MQDPPDIEALARRYLDLWQDQLTAIAADPDFAETMGRLFELMAWAAPPAGGPPPTGPMANDVTTKPRGSMRHDNKPLAEPSNGSAPPTAPRRDGGDDVARLTRRIADLEARLLALEKGSGGGGGRTGARARKNRR